MVMILLAGQLIEPALGRISEFQAADALRVRLEAGRGPYYAGQGVEIAALVLGREQRPKIDLPHIEHADIWIAGTSFKPVSATGIGSLQSSDNIYITRLRVVSHRAGELEIPAVAASIDGRSGRSAPLRLKVEPVPLEGRPAEFLGGVGDFTVQASASPATVRVGQEFSYRIVISGPAAWGSTLRPDLRRFDRVPLSLRIENLPDVRTNEPPSTTFVYRIRPSRTGSGVLPPVSVTAFDPGSMRYITKVTQSLPIKAAAVPNFDPKTVNYRAPDPDRDSRITWEIAAFCLILCALAGLAAIIRQRRRRQRPTNQRLARAVARRMLRELSQAGSQGRPEGEVARKVVDGLIAYARHGAGRPPGASLRPRLDRLSAS